MDPGGGGRLRRPPRRRDRPPAPLDEPPAVDAPTVVVSRKGTARARARHPWIYRSDVVLIPENLENGAIVRVTDERGHALGRATWSERSRISLRFVRWEDEDVDDAFWAVRLETALARRERDGMTGPARRIVFGEGDEWPGLVVDQYGDCLVLQTLTPAADRLARVWTRLLVERFAPRAVVARNDLKVRALEGLAGRIETWHGEPPGPFAVRIGDRDFTVDLLRGQKTGAFLDQQENWRAAARRAAGAAGALDAFAGEGGFALHLAAVVGSVEAVEVSAEAAARGEANAAANGIENVAWTVGNAFDRLHRADMAGERFDAVVLDPPAFAKSRKSVPGALRGYKEINLRAIKILAPGGILITCSCSYHMSRERLIGVVADAVGDAGRVVELLEVRTQSPDHPILVNVPETEYLKCLILRVR